MHFRHEQQRPSPSPPTQAVILAGGRGTRLLPLTAALPKPMLAVEGRPFLEYLIGMLRDQGITRVLLLLGYLPEPIVAHFGDGGRFGVAIEYLTSDVDDDTGRRLWLARDRVDPEFLLLYCDNYWPLDLADLWRSYRERGCLAQVVAYRNADGYTRSNLRVGGDGRVEVYDRARQAQGLNGVDIGFILLRREVLDMLPEGANVSFEAEVYPRLVAAGHLAAVVSDHRYYSIGSHDRLELTAAFLRRRPTIFLDRDGTLNRRPPPGDYVLDWRDWSWLPGSLDALRRLSDAGWRILVVTNQPGIGRGMLAPATLDGIHARMLAEARAHGGIIDDILVCPHDRDEGCGCRKPAPGMLIEAQRRFHIDLSRTPLIGDDERDGMAAAAAGCPYHVLEERENLHDCVERLLDGRWAGPWQDNTVSRKSSDLRETEPASCRRHAFGMTRAGANAPKAKAGGRAAIERGIVESPGTFDDAYKSSMETSCRDR
ncbi:MAG: HAD-IIIA family hydrolase [Alphaproteobacteria bacterium]